MLGFATFELKLTEPCVYVCMRVLWPNAAEVQCLSLSCWWRQIWPMLSVLKQLLLFSSKNPGGGNSLSHHNCLQSEFVSTPIRLNHTNALLLLHTDSLDEMRRSWVWCCFTTRGETVALRECCGKPPYT